MNFSKKSGKKKAAAAAVICFVAAIAITGTYTFNDYRKSQSEKDLAMAEEMNLTEENTDETVDGEIVANELTVEEADVSMQKQEEMDDVETPEKVEETSSEEVGNISTSNAANVNFSEDT